MTVNPISVSVRDAAQVRARVDAQRKELERTRERLEADLQRLANEMPGAKGASRSRRESAYANVEAHLEQTKRDIEALKFHDKAASERLTRARAFAPARKAAVKELETLCRELAAIGVSIPDDLDAIGEKINRLRAGAERVKTLRTELGLGAGEAWWPFSKSRMVETIAANIASWLRFYGAPGTVKLPPAKRTLAQHFAEAEWRQYLPDDEPLPPAA
jgi:hypothetical protein